MGDNVLVVLILIFRCGVVMVIVMEEEKVRQEWLESQGKGRKNIND